VLSLLVGAKIFWWQPTEFSCTSQDAALIGHNKTFSTISILQLWGSYPVRILLIILSHFPLILLKASLVFASNPYSTYDIIQTKRRIPLAPVCLQFPGILHAFNVKSHNITNKLL
jgi:hypothetical protein